MALPLNLFLVKNIFLMLFFRTKLDQIHDKAEPDKKISYFTPRMHGLQLAISYNLDSANLGGACHNEDRLKATSAIVNVKLVESDDYFILNRHVKDGFSAGLSYQDNKSAGLSLKLAATGEYAKAASESKLIANKGEDKYNTEINEVYKLSDLRTYNLGAILTFGSFSYPAYYGSMSNSLTARKYHLARRTTDYFNGAVALKQGRHIKTSYSYFRPYHD